MADEFGAGAAGAVWGTWVKLWGDCFEDAGDDAGKKLLCYIKLVIPFVILLVATIVAAVVDFFVWIGKGIGSIFNGTADDDARAAIRSLSLDEISSQSNEQLDRWTEDLLDGPTGDDDENALLKIIRSLPCDRLAGTYWPRWGSRIRSDIDGSEFDQLQIELLRCGLVDVASWDDDATRRFIRSTPCEALGALSVRDLRELFDNLFDGYTGDDDERAIIELTRCIPVGKVVEILSTRGTRRSDFDDEVDGSEWRTLNRVWAEMGITFS